MAQSACWILPIFGLSLLLLFLHSHCTVAMMGPGTHSNQEERSSGEDILDGIYGRDDDDEEEEEFHGDDELSDEELLADKRRAEGWRRQQLEDRERRSQKTKQVEAPPFQLDRSTVTAIPGEKVVGYQNLLGLANLSPSRWCFCVQTYCSKICSGDATKVTCHLNAELIFYEFTGVSLSGFDDDSFSFDGPESFLQWILDEPKVPTVHYIQLVLTEAHAPCGNTHTFVLLVYEDKASLLQAHASCGGPHYTLRDFLTGELNERRFPDHRHVRPVVDMFKRVGGGQVFTRGGMRALLKPLVGRDPNAARSAWTELFGCAPEDPNASYLIDWSGNTVTATKKFVMTEDRQPLFVKNLLKDSRACQAASHTPAQVWTGEEEASSPSWLAWVKSMWGNSNSNSASSSSSAAERRGEREEEEESSGNDDSEYFSAKEGPSGEDEEYDDNDDNNACEVGLAGLKLLSKVYSLVTDLATVGAR
eukprot:gnl/Hemi2/16929_TR5622_c0_g1_i1.p1 gnl/Hemi2/16929_TR5622_c0_g1~~gnl/Hemi2/16929_TR5622_c0_g1_i1.p1  ORF type:complete len:476 (+),score=94.83 gnl/Hemi2/16929_TR5622_c0_g1_i1:120-1547(+)